MILLSAFRQLRPPSALGTKEPLYCAVEISTENVNSRHEAISSRTVLPFILKERKSGVASTSAYHFCLPTLQVCPTNSIMPPWPTDSEAEALEKLETPLLYSERSSRHGKNSPTYYTLKGVCHHSPNSSIVNS
jgi:hypothetical protein